jgi:pyruvate formate lyase activating enzyme
MKINIGKMIPISTVDWHGKSSSVIFFNGCPFRCPYCQNYKLLDCKKQINIEIVEKDILDAKMFISAVVFSGGEPAMRHDELIMLAKFIKREGLLVGIQTNGYYPDTLKELVDKKLIDKIFLDIKTNPLNSKKYGHLVGNIHDASHRVVHSLHIPDIDIEVRTTIFRSLNDTIEIAKYLEEHNYNGDYIIQQGIPWNTKTRKEDILKRNEIMSVAKNIGTFLERVKIRTIEKGEEDIL